MSTLFVVATPIGNLEDVSLRALRVLGEVGALACEDTRRTRVLLERHGVRPPPTVFAYHEHNEREAAARVVGLLEKGVAVALVTNAGYPCVSDPGYLAVSLAAERGVRVEIVPGPGAVEAALAASGIPCASFTFKGFPPRKPGKRRRFLETERDSPHALVFFESPLRAGRFLAEALRCLGDRRAAVCIELTKAFERVRRGTLSALAEEFGAGPVKGEVTVVIAGRNERLEARGAREAHGDARDGTRTPDED